MHFFYLAPFYLTTLALAAPRFPSKHALIARAFEEDGESDWLAEEPSPELERGDSQPASTTSATYKLGSCSSQASCNICDTSSKVCYEATLYCYPEAATCDYIFDKGGAGEASVAGPDCDSALANKLVDSCNGKSSTPASGS